MTLPTSITIALILCCVMIFVGILIHESRVKKEIEKNLLEAKISSIEERLRKLEDSSKNVEEYVSDLAGYLELNTDISDLMIESLAKQLNELKGGKQ